MNQATDAPVRPLSPHLQVYRWGIGNSLSILHRATGVFLSVGLLVLSCWLIATAIGGDAYGAVMELYGSVWFRVPLAGWAFCFFYHLANGVRHLFWDVGLGFERGSIRTSGIAVVVFAIVATAGYVLVGMI
jgi:succinate dehydrogenase / fumarate reductase cytochrome b subunit